MAVATEDLVHEAIEDADTSPGLTATFMENRARLSKFMLARCRRTADPSEVEDAMQELWLRCRAIDASGIANQKSYLFRIAHNLIVDRARKIENGRRYDADWAYVEDRGHGGAERGGADRDLIAKENLRALDRSLRKIGERAAWIFHRHRLEGVAQHQIAMELGLSLSTVEKDIRKAYDAISTFRERLDAE